MKPIELRTKVDADGVLNLSVPLGKSEADREVHVTVQRLDEATQPMSAEQWHRFVHEMAGSIDDPTFQRHTQGEFEQRDELFQ